MINKFSRIVDKFRVILKVFNQGINMQKTKLMMSQLLLICFFITSCASTYSKNETSSKRIPAQEAVANSVVDQVDGEGKNDIGKTLKEIYLKGSIDGKSLFMVYGFEKASKDMSHIMKNAVSMKQLRNIGKAVNNKDHDGDYVDAVKEGADITSDIIDQYPEDVKDYMKWPWKSIKRMKKSYKISFDNARDAYYHSSNPIGGSVKYAGHAIWANVKGAYYLVVEIPVTTAAAIGVTVGEGALIPLAVPLAVVIQTLNVAWKTFVFLARTAIVVPFKVTVAAVEGTYAFISTTTAATVTLVAAGGLAVYKGARWLVYTLPKKFTSPIEVQAGSQVGVDDQEEYAAKVSKNLEQSVLSNDLKLTQQKIKEYTSKFTLSSGTIAKAVSISLGIDHQKVKVSALASKAFIKSLKTEGRTRDEVKQEVEELLQKIVDQIIAIQ